MNNNIKREQERITHLEKRSITLQHDLNWLTEQYETKRQKKGSGASEHRPGVNPSHYLQHFTKKDMKESMMRED